MTGGPDVLASDVLTRVCPLARAACEQSKYRSRSESSDNLLSFS